jgi:HK97 family phage prohead protease
MTIERRFISVTELRAAKDGNTITGVAAAYNKLSLPIGENGKVFRERILPGAFQQVLNKKPDVTLLVNHDRKLLLGRTASGTLQLNDTKRGLEFRCSMPNTQLGYDTREMIQRGDLNGCSFSFGMSNRAEDQDWQDEELEDEEDLFGGKDKKQEGRARPKKMHALVRTIKNIASLHDVSVVTNPAYEDCTSVDCRSRIEIYGEIPASISKRYVDPKQFAILLDNSTAEEAVELWQQFKVQ